jgi:hypothetical protein
MGLFDSLIWKCVLCGAQNIAQTKSGPCLLDEFNFEDENLPLWLMEDFHNTEEVCYKCKRKMRLVFDLKVKVRRKAIEPIDNLDWIELEHKKRQLKNLSKHGIIGMRRNKYGHKK